MFLNSRIIQSDLPAFTKGIVIKLVIYVRFLTKLNFI